MARAGAHCALSAAQAVLGGAPAAFALSRPPGHHAGADYFGGYCFLNYAALAAQHLRDAGLSCVAVLDVDYHHGNGIQIRNRGQIPINSWIPDKVEEDAGVSGMTWVARLG